MPRLLVGLLTGALLAPAAPAPAAGQATVPAGLQETRVSLAERAAFTIPQDPASIVHLLNRIGYGPHQGDVERVRAQGVQSYILAQLDPESIPDPEVEERLRAYRTLDMETPQLAAMMRERRKALKASKSRGRGATAERGAPAETANGLEPAAVRGSRGDPNATEAPAEKSGTRRRVQARQDGPDPAKPPVVELAVARLERAIHSRRQLEEVLVDFWMNHFNVFAGKGADRVLLTSYERDAIRPHALGRFEDLLSATAHHPAMLFYLDNWLSVAPAARPTGGRAGKRAPSGINENYARELLELHTLGVDGGYTQQDVIEVARAFTGWSIARPRQGGGFVFRDRTHDDGPKGVLGHALPAGGGEGDGEAVLQILATHPSTARFVSMKLAQRFVADAPPQSLVEAMVATWRRTDGDIREVLRTMLESPEFWDPAVQGAKVKTPFELVVSSARALDLEALPRPLLKALRVMNHVPYGAEAPTGYPETADAWLDAGALERRVELAQEIAAQVPLAARDWAAGAILGRLFPAGSSAELAAAVEQAVARGSAREGLALALASPEFQKQ